MILSVEKSQPAYNAYNIQLLLRMKQAHRSILVILKLKCGRPVSVDYHYLPRLTPRLGYLLWLIRGGVDFCGLSA